MCQIWIASAAGCEKISSNGGARSDNVFKLYPAAEIPEMAVVARLARAVGACSSGVGQVEVVSTGAGREDEVLGPVDPVGAVGAVR